MSVVSIGDVLWLTFKKKYILQSCFLPYRPFVIGKWSDICFSHRHKIIHRSFLGLFSLLIFLNMQITVHKYSRTDPHPLVGRGQRPSAIWCSKFFLPVFMYFEIFNTSKTDSPHQDCFGLWTCVFSQRTLVETISVIE